MEIKKIASFRINHNTLLPGIYVSRVDGDVVTYDMRHRTPNTGDLMDNATMHSFEHMFATYIRSSEIGERVLYFGPMGCQTGFYLLVREGKNEETLAAVQGVLTRIIAHDGEMFGASAVECGNYKNLSVALARDEAKRYLAVLKEKENWSFLYDE